MKCIRIFTLIGMLFVLTSLNNLCSAQDIEGFELGGKYTRNQIIQKFGNPISFETGGDASDETEGTWDYYKFNGLTLQYQSTSGLSTFVIKNNRYRALTSKINGGIRVGDSMEKMSGFKPYDVNKSDDGASIVHSYYFEDDRLIFKVSENNNVICRIVGANLY